MKKILIISLAYFPNHVGGAEVAIKEITNRITPEDIEFHMVTLALEKGLPKEEKIRNVVVHRVGFGNTGILNKFLFQFSAAWKALSLHRKNQYDAIWAMMAHSSGAPAALFKFFKPRVPYILTLQEGDPPERIERMMWPLWPLFSRAFKRADVVQAISVFLGEWARRRGFKGSLEVVPNGVDTRHFSREYPARAIDEVKDTLGKRMGDVFLITTSRLVRKNALDNVIAALPLLPENVRFIILGTGPLEAELKEQARSSKLEARTLFLGQIGHDELPKYLKACDIFIRPSRSEGMGNSFVEAMAAGLPVIATQEGGIADFLFDEKRNLEKPITGWAVDKDSPEQIAAQVKHVMEHPEKVRAVIATACAMVMEKYDWDIIAKDMRERVFMPLLERGDN
ncbi:MAG: Glycosyltransferase [Candidatus Kaiserbacteria bacterium GW2011_GWC2_52_8b]|uniref:Glycosyltransferase n=1 Tax=Candidatus Kaiserbacteria bacterium GW2011_GWC2_52_8b TaxID=1618676 RepID=A0A0G1XGN1_9BACT|nr:MAG: Glycosyltransferase [Candidatus Kaiserbacteria bacterium GW2011_GWC2_52_8b]